MHNKRIGRDDLLKIEVSRNDRHKWKRKIDMTLVGTHSTIC